MGESMGMVRFFCPKMKKPLAGLPHASPTRTIHLWFPRLSLIYNILMGNVKFSNCFTAINHLPLILPQTTAKMG